MPNLKILVVDDVDEIRRALRNIINPPQSASSLLEALLRPGSLPTPNIHRVDEAAQGEEGVAKVLQAETAGSPYDLIILDMIMLPGIDGVETLRRIRGAGSRSKVVICTGNTTDTTASEEIDQINGEKLTIFHKPLDESSIRNLISKLELAKGNHVKENTDH